MRLSISLPTGLEGPIRSAQGQRQATPPAIHACSKAAQRATQNSTRHDTEKRNNGIKNTITAVISHHPDLPVSPTFTPTKSGDERNRLIRRKKSTVCVCSLPQKDRDRWGRSLVLEEQSNDRRSRVSLHSQAFPTLCHGPTLGTVRIGGVATVACRCRTTSMRWSWSYGPSRRGTSR